MSAGDIWLRRWTRSLKARLVAFLTIALLPLGLIAVLQTVQVMREAERIAERDLLSRTARAASEEGAVLRRAFGAAEALGIAAAELADNPEACSRFMSDFTARQPTFIFAGFIAADGVMACSSMNATIDYADTAEWQDFLSDPRRLVNFNPDGDASHRPVFIIVAPVFASSGELLGGQAVSIPHDLAQTLLVSDVEDVKLALITPAGEIISTSIDTHDARAFERLGIVPAEMHIPPSGLILQTRRRVNNIRQPASIVPLIRDEVYVIGLWTPGEDMQAVPFLGRVVPLFPIVMWLASLAVAYLTINNLVLRHLSRLSTRMEQYRSGESVSDFELSAEAPAEIRDIADSYNDLVMRVALDQATLENSVHEKELLLREIHHRVKNNLQLISSILNMQIRGVRDDAAKKVLKRVQDRVMSLSSIHQALYSDTRLDVVRLDALLAEIVAGVGDVGLAGAQRVAVRTDLAPISLDPDHAVPLLLLATEAMTNATKYVGVPEGGSPEIDVSLRETGENGIVFRATNTRGPQTDRAIAQDAEADGSGLGARLIEAFASQLGGTVNVEMTEDLYDLKVNFRRAG